MRTWRNGLMVAAGLAMVGFMPQQPQPDANETPWEIADVVSAKIAVPRGWRKMDKVRDTIPVFRQSAGLGVPTMDDTMSSFKLSISVEEKINSTETIEQVMNGQVAALKKDQRLEVAVKESVEKIRLADDTEALLMRMELVKDKAERHVQIRLVAKDMAANIWIVSGTVTGGKNSKWVTQKGKFPRWLEAHVRSLTFAGGKFDAAALKAAYDEKNKK